VSAQLHSREQQGLVVGLGARELEVPVPDDHAASSGSAGSGRSFQQDCCIVGGGPAGMVRAPPLLQVCNSPAAGLLSAVNSLHDPQSK